MDSMVRHFTQEFSNYTNLIEKRARHQQGSDGSDDY